MDTKHHIDIENQSGPRKGKVLAGIILLAVGASLLLKQLDLLIIPHWLFSGPMWVIAAGLYFGANSNFRKPIWLLVMLFGVIQLFGNIFREFDADAVTWPFMLIAFGIWLILRRNNPNFHWDKKSWKNKWENSKYDFGTPVPAPGVAAENSDEFTSAAEKSATEASHNYYSGDEHLDAISIFGSVKKTIYSKNFQGGEIVNVFGGAEIDLTQADIKGRVIIEITQIFGGVKMIVPSHWTVVSDVAAIFAGFDDKRVKTTAPLDANKILVLKGTSIFAGVDIRSY